ncbi:MAG: CPBP family intramembrane metalloprotease [Candidatus Dormibacteraeota bacterium]|nr:CPBP family intramembrane metalloprotease [Candidatus Dormibacteraeota bacterium]
MTGVALQAVPLVGSEQLLNFLPLAVILVANWAVAQPAGAPPARVAAALGRGIWLLLGVVGACSALAGLLLVAAGTTRAYGLAVFVGGLAAGSVVVPAVRRAIARLIPIDPLSPLDATAVALTLLLVANQVGVQLAGDVLIQTATNPRLQPVDVIINELPFLAAALLGVGLFIRRSPRETLARLALVRPAWWHVVLALACAGVFYAFSLGADAAAQTLTPEISRKVGAATEELFGGLTNPLGIATIALSSGICEEAFFRGALQPRVGLLWASFVFAIVHTQYGLSIQEVAVFVLALGLGFLRSRTNTTTTMICHVVYNTIVAVHLSTVLLGPSLAAEGVLVAVLVGAAVLALRGRAVDRV